MHISFFNKKTKGFAMLFTVLVMSLILTIAIGISNISLKQTILSSLAKDSQIAFYQADKGIECGLYYDLNKDYFPKDTKGDVDPNVVPKELPCGKEYVQLLNESYTNYLIYKENAESPTPCVKIIIDKTDPSVTTINSQGYNICGDGQRKVERALRVQY